MPASRSHGRLQRCFSRGSRSTPGGTVKVTTWRCVMARQPFGPVIVGVDGSGASLAAVELAAEEAMARVAPLTVVHVRGESVRYGGGHVEAPEEARRVVALAVGRAQSEHPGLSVTARLVPGEPAAVLAELSRGASLLVVGHREIGRASCRER